MFEWLAQSSVDLLVRYGYLALFVFLFLESSMLFPFVPSELVVPVGAGLLVTGPVSFGLFVTSAAAGSTVGGLLLYYLSDTAGERVVARYGRYVHLSRSEFERGQRWFRRWGESSVFWGRFLPVLRSVISVPAGLAEMGYGRFALYTAAGTGAYAAAVVGLVRAGVATTGVSFRVLLGRAWAVATSRPLIAVGLAAALVVGYAAYRAFA